MKLMILRVICVLLIVAGLGLYVYGVEVNGEAPTENLARTLILVLSGMSALIKLTPKRRPLEDYGELFAKDLGSAFADDTKKREALLEAIRLFDESKYDKALKTLNALSLDARTKDEHNALGLFTALCQTNLGLNEAAAATYEEAIRKGGGTSRMYSNLGSRYDALEQPEKAIDAYVKAAELDAENALPHSNLANLLIRYGAYEEAEAAAKQALVRDPQLYQASSVLAMICAVQGRMEDKKKYFDMAVSAGQDAAGLERACSYYIAKEKARAEAENM